MTATFEYEIAKDFCFRHLVHCANKATNSGEERRVNLKQAFVVVYNCVVFVPVFPLQAKEWAEIFLNSNYLAGIRQRGINGGTRSIRFQRCVLEGTTRERERERDALLRHTREMRKRQISDVRLSLCSFPPAQVIGSRQAHRKPTGPI